MQDTNEKSENMTVNDSSTIIPEKNATELASELKSMFDNAVEFSVQKKRYTEASEIFGELLKKASEKYGELSPLLGPIYYRYGDTLLASVEESAEALGEANATDSVEKAESQNEDEEDGDDEDNADNSATAIEEDLTEKEVQDETNPDDLQVAWECLDVARVIYEKLGESASIELSQIYLRLGDCHMESDTFDKAVEEYSKCLALRAPRVPRYDRRLSDVLSSLMNAHLSLATKSGVDENSRSSYLLLAEQYCQAAAESMIEAAISVAKSKSLEAFVTAAQKEIEAGAVTKRLPPGLVTSALGVPSHSSSSTVADDAKYEECTVRIFSTLYSTHTSSGVENRGAIDSEGNPVQADDNQALPVAYSLGNASSGRIVKLEDACDVADLLLQRLQEIRSDMSINVDTLRSEIEKDPHGPVHSVGFGTTTVTTAGPVAVLAPRRRVNPETEVKPEASTNGLKVSPPAGSAPSESEEPVVGQKRPLENAQE